MNGYPLITKTWPIRMQKHLEDGIAIGSVPDMAIITGLRDLWIIIEQIVEDWKVGAAKYQRKIDQCEDGEARKRAFTEAFWDLRPRYIQCVFSYVIFFLMLENGYETIHSQLRKFNKDHGLRLKSAKKPRRTPFIEKLITVRNYSVAHWADPSQKDPINARAGLYWALRCPVNQIANVEFGPSGVSGAKPRDLGSIPEIHEACMVYLQEFDRVCTGFLQAIKSRLPMVEDGWEYTDLDTLKPVAPDGTTIGQPT